MTPATIHGWKPIHGVQKYTPTRCRECGRPEADLCHAGSVENAIMRAAAAAFRQMAKEA